ncbi:hypothetical protein [Emticicia sp. C21]|uniref:hypothetical protein n=1 Tax=Emticicia sp. C21 TaxID=2302915 RepID=UPI000E34E417|nr:hypothetical protein [Emticicia sp. C21]RFS15925.1 hypothetical protein D0T08_13550 [Emticicia sp. C21]
MRNILSEEEIEATASKYYERISTVVQTSFQDYSEIANIKLSQIACLDFKARSICSLILDFIRARATEEFGSDAEVISGEARGIFYLIIEKKIVVRFKKMKDAKDFKMSSLETKQSLKYINQLSMSAFPDELTLFYAGYIPNKTWTNLVNIPLVCRKGQTVIWHKDMKHEMTQLTLGLSLSNEPSSENTNRVKAIKPSQEQRDGTNG